MIRGAGAQPTAAPRSHPAGPGTRLGAALGRACSPVGYLLLFGGMQLGLVLLLSRFWPLWLTATGSMAFLALVMVVARVRGQWRTKMVGLLVVIGLLVVGPGVVLMHDRTARGVTSMEHDGAIQSEVAMDRLLQGKPIYGVDWSGTAMGRVPWNYSLGPRNPALRHNAYAPLVPLVGIPVAWLVRGVGMPFDYRQVLLLFLGLGLACVFWLPIDRPRRFAIAAVLFLSPLLGLYYWAGRNDMPVVALLLLGAGLLTRDRPTAGSLVVGTAVAYKLFAAPAVPFLLASLWLRWRASRDGTQLARSLLALVAVPLITVVPFFVWTPAAFVRDVVLYPGAGGPESYPISGFGLGGVLLAVHAVHRSDPFPFWIFELAGLLVALRLTLPWFLRRPSLGRFMTGSVACLFAITFFARYFNDSHAALVLVLLAICVPLGDAALLAPQPAVLGSRRSSAGWLDVGTWR